jgi:hypothetical protein
VGHLNSTLTFPSRKSTPCSAVSLLPHATATLGGKGGPSAAQTARQRQTLRIYITKLQSIAAHMAKSCSMHACCMLSKFGGVGLCVKGVVSVEFVKCDSLLSLLYVHRIARAAAWFDRLAFISAVTANGHTQCKWTPILQDTHAHYIWLQYTTLGAGNLSTSGVANRCTNLLLQRLGRRLRLSMLLLHSLTAVAVREEACPGQLERDLTGAAAFGPAGPAALGH